MTDKQCCNKINKLIPIKNEGDRDKINSIFYEYVSETENDINSRDLYFDRDVYIDYNGDTEAIKKDFLNSGKLHLEPTEDKVEHPGVCIRYIENKK